MTGATEPLGTAERLLDRGRRRLRDGDVMLALTLFAEAEHEAQRGLELAQRQQVGLSAVSAAAARAYAEARAAWDAAIAGARAEA